MPMTWVHHRTRTSFYHVIFLVLIVLVCSAAVFAQNYGNTSYSYNFPSSTNYAVPGQGGIAIADFSGSGVPDIAIANGDSTVSILLGNGDGTFKPQYTVTAVPSSSTYLTEWVAVGDFNGDGYQDLAVLCVSTLSTSSPTMVTGSINILLNKADGSGTFNAPTVIPLQGTGSTVVQAAHFGTDTNFDLAILNVGSENVSILLGNGNGTFQSEVDYATSSQPAGLAIGDLNNDGYADLAVAGTNGNDGVVSVLLGNANGTFGTAVNWVTEDPSSPSCIAHSCGPPTTVVIADFNSDGKQDLATNDGSDGGIFVLLGNGDGSFQTPSLHSGGAASDTGIDFLAVGDWNSDGKPDLAMSVGIISALNFPDLLVYLGNGDGTFSEPAEISVGTAGEYSKATSIAAADLNDDGIPDLALATNPGNNPTNNSNAVTVVLNCGLKCSATTLSSSQTVVSFNQSVTLTAIVTLANAKATLTPTGSVIFQDLTGGSTLTLGTGTLAAGQATFTTSSLAVGTHYLAASYQGDANFVPSPSAELAQGISEVSTTTAISSSVDPSSPGQSVTFTATVTPSTSGVPTVTMLFSVDGSPAVSATLNSTGSATFTTSSLSAGTHEITCNYSGDGNFEPSNSFLIQIVGTNAPPFTLVSYGGSSFSVTAGQSVPIGIAVKSVPNFKSAITFSCSGLPAGATCSFGPAQITPTSYISYTTLTIATSGSQSSIPTFTPPLSNRVALPGILGLGALALWFVRPQRARRRPLPPGLAVVGVSVCVLCAAIGCGGGSGGGGGGGSGTPAPAPTPSGSYQITVTGTSGSTTHSVPITLTVT